MINIIESPIRADRKISHEINQDILTIILDGVSEEFDFSGLPEGKMESAAPELLPINPILSAEKIGEEITIKLLRFYSFEEKHLFETGEPVDAPYGGEFFG